MTDPISSHVLRDGDTRITVLSMGCAVQDWQVAGRRVVLGYDDPEAYRLNPKSMGIVVGRVVNRIGYGRFTLDGQEWHLPLAPGAQHHLHGGPAGLGKRNWQITPVGDRAVVLRLHSPHLDQGYPGAVDFQVRISLDGAALTWDLTARPDRETPVNLAQHLYFNLAGAGTVRDHALQLRAAHVTPTGPDLIPTGALMPVAGTRFDFRVARAIAQADPESAGYDLNYALDDGDGPVAEVTAPDGMRLRLWTDQPGLQVYTSNSLTEYAAPWPGPHHGPFGGICLEAQVFPNALNTPEFPSILVSPDTPYRQVTTIEIAPS
ncbi:aldose epimerase family protein [Antarctobacter jejuensis]|uniref:aldose epimerase family protein n=1 Tax=Antarctobacter jejuensis TaxID=1439938 RepID=UPI003FD59BE5